MLQLGGGGAWPPTKKKFRFYTVKKNVYVTSPCCEACSDVTAICEVDIDSHGGVSHGGVIASANAPVVDAVDDTHSAYRATLVAAVLAATTTNTS